MKIAVDIAVGELVDKITILKIKLDRITDDAKLANVRNEYEILQNVYRREVSGSHDLAELSAELQQVNEAIWDLEDSIRALERAQDFGEKFVEIARSVYRTNDRRAALKRAINELVGSHIVEEKSYAAY